MSIHLEPPSDPVMSDVPGRRLVLVAPGKVRQSVQLLVDNDADGFSFNGARGVDQRTMDSVLNVAKPKIVDVYRMPNIDYSSIYACSTLQCIGVGGGTAWPDFTRLPPLRGLWVDEAKGPVEILPSSLLDLSFFGYPGKDLLQLSHLTSLEQLDVTSASRLATLQGIPASIASLTLSGCPKLRDITAISKLPIAELRLDRCRALEDVDVVYELHSLRKIFAIKIPAQLDRERLEGMQLEYIHVRR